MTDAEKLERAVNVVNGLNREGARPLVEVVSCGVCGRPFASQVQDAELARRRGLDRICPLAECQSEARRRRQRGERPAQDDLRRVFFALLELGGAHAGVQVRSRFTRKGAPWSAVEQEADGLDSLRQALHLDGRPLQEWLREVESRPDAIPVKALLRRAGEAAYPLIYPSPRADREAVKARTFELLGPVAWGVKAELERYIERPGDWAPELRQIWPEAVAASGT